MLKFGWNSVFSADKSSSSSGDVSTSGSGSGGSSHDDIGMSQADVDRLIDRRRGLTDDGNVMMIMMMIMLMVMMIVMIMLMVMMMMSGLIHLYIFACFC